MTATHKFKARFLSQSDLECLKDEVILGFPEEAGVHELTTQICKVDIRKEEECDSKSK